MRMSLRIATMLTEIYLRQQVCAERVRELRIFQCKKDILY